MTLLDELKVPCHKMTKVSVPDGVGSFIYKLTEGDSFSATIIKNRTAITDVAEKEELTETFTVVVDKEELLSINDIFVRETDGQAFRVTGSTRDTFAPERSTVQIGKVTAERWDQ